MKYFIGLDIGGTSVKGISADEKGNILAEGSVPTPVGDGGALCDEIAALCGQLSDSVNGGKLCGVGVGCPGLIEGESGVLLFSGNLKLKDFLLKSELEKRLGTEVRITNDANAAALGEARFGAGKSYSESILVTLGTGVGGGIVIGGKLFEGYKAAGAEIGHMVIERHGNRCTCGRRGCLEAYASATALIAKTKEWMAQYPDSAMWEKYTLDTVNGKTAFEYKDTDRTAKEVVDWYIDYLACGLINLANIFRPQVIMLGGGIANEGEGLTVPLQEKMDKEVFGGNDHARVHIVTATLGNKAGALGAVALYL